jgi:hypothetical protein
MADSLDERGQTPQEKAAERGYGKLLRTSSESEHLHFYPREIHEYMTDLRSEQTSKRNDVSLLDADGFHPRAPSVPNTETPPLVPDGLLVDDHKRDGDETLLQERKSQSLQHKEALRQGGHPTHQEQLPPSAFGEPQLQHSMPEHEPLVFEPFRSTHEPQPETPPEIAALGGIPTSIPELKDEVLLQKEQYEFHDSAMEDGCSPASRASTEPEGQALASKAQPSEGRPPITFAESADALQQAEHGVEIGGDSERDDGYETDSSATSQSLVASARQFIFENGRRYHSYQADTRPYSFPNDDREQDREDLKHALFLKLFNKTLHFAPVPGNGANVLDLGTGTGIWAVDCMFMVRVKDF